MKTNEKNCVTEVNVNSINVNSKKEKEMNYRRIIKMSMSCSYLVVRTRDNDGVEREVRFQSDMGFLEEYHCFTKFMTALDNALNEYGWGFGIERGEVYFYDDKGEYISPYELEDYPRIRIKISEDEWQNILLCDYERQRIIESEEDWEECQREMLEFEGVEASEEMIEKIKRSYLNNAPESLVELGEEYFCG